MSNSKIKEFILDVTPPILRNIFIRYKDRNAYPKFNQKYWSENKDNYEHELRVMVDAFLASDDYKQTTKYWSHLLRNNLESIRKFGLKTYGQHAAKNYFTFTDFSDETIKNLTHTAGKIESIDIFKHHKGFSKCESIKHNILIQLLLNSV